MRRLGYGINSYHKTVSIYIDFAPFWVFWLDSVFYFLCNKTPPIPLPPIPIKLTDETSIELNDGSNKTNLKEWCGTLRDLFHLYVHEKVLDFCWRKTDGRAISVNYNKARKAFYDKDKEFWDEQEEVARELEKERRKEVR